MRLALAILLLAAGAHGADFDTRLVQTGRRAARAFIKLAQRAEKEKQRATARILFERALELDANNSASRKALGFKRSKAVWVRSRESAAEVGRRRDSDLARMQSLRSDRRSLEEAHTEEVLTLCRKHGTPEQARDHLRALLEYTPRNDAVHAALGHEKIDGRRVRPELVSFARTMRARLDAWSACVATEESKPSDQTVVIAGLRGAQPVFKVGTREVASGFPVKATARFANKTECVQSLLRLTLGDAVKAWDRGPVYFLKRDQYRAYLGAKTLSPSARAGWLKRRHFWGENVQVFGARDLSEALDFYAHAAAVYTIDGIDSPFEGTDPTRGTNAWLLEGYGLFVTLELFDTAETFLTSGRESTGKIESPLPPPEPVARTSALAHIRDELYVGSLPSLRELLGTSMNGLDKVGSVQAWTFIRFLLLLDPDGFKKLPAAMRDQQGDSRAERSARALKQAFGVDAAELERLWRMYVLELS